MGFLATAAFLGLGWVSFHDVIDRREHPNRNLVVEPGASELVLRRDRAGHYRFPGWINGRPVRFLLDTGATQVAIPSAVAERLGLQRGAPIIISTANGRATGHRTRLDSLRLGDIELRDVAALIAPGMDGDEVLLGMSALKQLEFSQKGGTLVLRQSTLQ